VGNPPGFWALCILASCAPADAPPFSEGPATDPEEFRALGYTDWEEVGEELPLMGVTHHSEGEAVTGVNLYTDQESTCLAVDMDGRELHRWTVPDHDQVECFELLADGSILALSVDQGVSRLDRESRVTWRADLTAHHDLAVLPGGEVLVPTHREILHAGRRVRFDEVMHLDNNGEVLGVWDSHGAKETLAKHHAPHPLDSPADSPTEAVYDFYHLNAVEVLPTEVSGFPAASKLLCLRNVDLLVLLSPDYSEVLWSFGPGILDQPHSPGLTPEGRILVFDNGRGRGHSRLVEVDPATDTVTWTWEATPPEAFFSPIRGACQRLADGHTLVTESERGRVFELNAAGERVWEFWSPLIVDGQRRRIYRMHRVSTDRVASWLQDR